MEKYIKKRLKPVIRNNSTCATICKQCGRRFRYMKAYINHEEVCNRIEAINKKLLAKSNVARVRAIDNRRNLSQLTEVSEECKRCGKRFASRREAAIHIQKCRCRMWHYRCLACDTIIKLKSGIERHHVICTGILKANKHSHKDISTVLLTRQNATAQCVSCKRLFLTVIGLKLHSCSSQPDFTDRYIYTCNICSKNYLMRSVAEKHVQSHYENDHLRGGARLQPEQWGYSESFLDIDTKTFDRKVIAPLLIADYRKELLDRRFLGCRGLKAVSVFKIFFRKPTEDYKGENRNIEVYFHSNPITVLEGRITEDIANLLDYVDNQIADYTTNGSGFVMTKVDSVTNKYYTYKQLMGGRNGNELLPKQFYTFGKVVKIEYSDATFTEELRDKCFKQCLQMHEYKRTAKGALKAMHCSTDNAKQGSDVYFYASINDIHNVSLDRYDMKCVQYPMPLKNISQFQKDNVFVKINIFEIEHQDTELDDEVHDLRPSQYFLVPYYISKVCSEDVINLLYWGRSSHFYYINNLNGLVKMMRPFGASKIRRHSKLCTNCLQFIDLRYIQMEIHEKMCFENKPQQTIYPAPGAKWSFKRYGLMNKLGIFVVADFEASIIPVSQPPTPNLHFKNLPSAFNKAINKDVYKHLCDEAEFPYRSTKANNPISLQRVNSVAYTLHIPENYIDFPYDAMEQIGGLTGSFYASGDTSKDEENLIMLFMNWLKMCARIVEDYLKQQNGTNVQAQQRQNLHNAPRVKMLKTTTTICRYCREEFNNDSEKVLDHDHCDASFRSWVHDACNHKARSRKFNEFLLNIFFHNFQSYDCCPILKYAKQDININESAWECRTRGNKVQVAKCGNLLFRDSYQLLPLSLEKIGKSLPSTACKYQEKLTNTSSYGKEFYPYEWVNSVSKFEETEFPTIDKFESTISGPIAEKDYLRMKDFYNKNCKNFKEFHHHYLMRDIAVLLDALLYWQELMLKYFEIDLIQCESLPSASKECMLQVTRAEPELISDPVMFSYFSSNIRGGLTISSKRYVKIQPCEESAQQVKYFDFKSLYAAMQQQKLPIGGFSFIQPTPTVNQLRNLVASHDYDGEDGYLCIVNTHIPSRLHWLLSDLPPIATKLSVDPGFYPPHSQWFQEPKSRVKKLIAHLFDVDNYGVSIQTLRFLLTLGVEITAVNCLIKFKQVAFMRPYIDILQKLRAKSQEKGREDPTLDILSKLQANSNFGKLIESPFNYEQSVLVFTRETYEKRLRSNRFKSADFYEYSAMIKTKLNTVKLDKPVYGGMMVLDYAKLHLMSTYYCHILPAYIACAPSPFGASTRLRICYIDTDCFVLHTRLNDEEQLQFYNQLNYLFDFSTLPEEHLLFSNGNKYTIGVLKDEVGGRIVSEFATSGAKSYTIVFRDMSGVPQNEQSEELKDKFAPTIKCKTIPKIAQKQITIEDFRKAFNYPNERKQVEFNAIRICKGRQLYTVHCERKTLNPHDSKRYVLPGNYDSLALGHYVTLS